MKQQQICARFKWKDLTLTMFWDGATKGNKSRIDYEFKQGETLLMDGDDFCTPKYPDSIDSVTDLLGFLTIKPGDTDPDYFKHHSPAMLAWLNSTQCEELSIHVSDYEMQAYDASGEHFAKTFFEQHIEIMP